MKKKNHKTSGPWLALNYPANSRPNADDIKSDAIQMKTLEWCKIFFSDHIYHLKKNLKNLHTGRFALLVYPKTSQETSQFLSDFMAWWFLLDDRLESGYYREEDPKKRRALFRSYISSLRGSQTKGEIEDCFVLAARELGCRLPQFARAELCKRFCDSMEKWLFGGIEKELAICGDPKKTTVENYYQIRPFSSGVLPTLYLGELASAPMPHSGEKSEIIRELLIKAGQVIYLGNDIFSYHKELKRPCNFNLAIILKREKGLSEEEALTECARYHNEAVTKYIALKEELRKGGEGLWLKGMDNVLAGLIAWQLTALRYQGGNCFWHWI